MDSTSPSREERIAAVAFGIYEREGRPEGLDGEHWKRAAEALDEAEDWPPENQRPSEAVGEDFS
ncbi:MAG: DUF2934 domain-containing protein [Terrimicrobiaceae bacterium]|nr:DUF2934 domain-containing protein [Terrimicrobiaceae bacterium]